ncbi:hypothetical protein LOD99_8490 [Oopsacas minuta]|uniref:ISXO2-like transposase domain-containing protein n=1 Tax=Oopsacas minuta TaxID=111878 RepID=A0AAV7JFW2_9METZ|nr:hypothetical protein LOD99_8490 [Oopsacas minuta]
MATPVFRPVMMPTSFPFVDEIGLKELFLRITINRDNCIDWLRVHRLLARCMRCKCEANMSEGVFSKAHEGRGWRCPEKEGLQSTNFLTLNLKCSQNTITDWKNFLKHICVEKYLSNPEPIGGHGHIVEIDESNFGKRKYHRGRQLSEKWVFGGSDRVTKEAFMVTVEDRSASTLIPIIEQYIKSGTIIQSDEWASYNLIPPATFTHLTVNHSIQFVVPGTEIHTQTIESTWGQAKKKMRNSMTTNPELLDTYLAEYCWRKKYGDNPFHNLIIEIRNQYTAT